MSKISTLHVAAFGLWAVGLVLVVLWMVYALRTGGLGLLIAGAGGVLNIKVFLGELEERERRAFEFGRQVGAVQGEDVERIH